MSYLEGKKVIVGVTGCIAAYKAAEILRGLQKKGAQVRVVMTKSATGFISPNTFQALSGRDVLINQFKGSMGIPHIDLARKADLIIVAPATANTIAKLSLGIADNLLTSLVLAARCKLLVAPAMNDSMFSNTLTQKNLNVLGEQSLIVGPDSGDLACGEAGVGRMASTEDILFSAESLMSPGDFEKKHIVITAGATREFFDSVRFISNRSSGKMGMSIAKEAKLRGAMVNLVLANVPDPQIPGVVTNIVETSNQLWSSLNEVYPVCDILIMSAAVGDFKTEVVEKGKKKRKTGNFSLDLSPTEDILKNMVSRKRDHQKVVGFAAEFGDPLASVEQKMIDKGVDLLVANDISRDDIGFATDLNEVYIVGNGEPIFVSKRSKDAVAKEILNVIAGVA